MIMDKLTKLHFELLIDDFFHRLDIKNKEKLYELQKEMEDCIDTAIVDYCEDNHIE